MRLIDDFFQHTNLSLVWYNIDATTFSGTTLRVIDLIVALSINDTEQNDTL